MASSADDDLEASPVLFTSRHLQPIPLDPLKVSPSLSVTPFPLSFSFLFYLAEELFKS